MNLSDALFSTAILYYHEFWAAVIYYQKEITHGLLKMRRFTLLAEDVSVLHIFSFFSFFFLFFFNFFSHSSFIIIIIINIIIIYMSCYLII